MANIEIPLTGDFRGKNGWAAAKLARITRHETYVHCFAPTCYVGAPLCPHSVELEVYSRAVAQIAPIIVDLSPAEARALGAALVRAADAADDDD